MASEHQVPSYAALPPGQPGKVQAIAILSLVDGILSILLGLGLACGVTISTYGIGILCLPFFAYPVVVGILGIIYGAKLLAEPPKVYEPAQYLAIMQIINVLFGGATSLVAGILALVFYNDPEVKAYFAELALQQPTPTPYY